MNLKNRIYISLTRLLPKGYVKYFEKLALYSGMEENAAIYLGSSVLLSIFVALITLVWCIFYSNITAGWIVLIAVASVFAVQALFYLIAYFRTENRIEKVESTLPDQLQLMSNNIKSGMTPFKALKTSARKEFGPLSEEITNATNRALGVNSLTDVLLEIKTRIKSVILERVLKLETAALKTGGNFSQLLNELATDIRETQSLKNELVTKTKTYTAFILFTVLFGMPLLLAISNHFVSLISNFSSSVGLPEDAAAGFDLGMITGQAGIDPSFLISLSYVMLIATTILASMFLGVIQKGRMTSGLRYAPMLVIAALLIFMGARLAVGSMFGTMF